MGDFASVAILSYNRPDFVQQAIRSAREAPGYPLEIIVHDDGSDNRTQDMLHGMLQGGEISKLIMNPPGRNEGVGQAVKACFEVAQGKYLVKADQDLLFKLGWLNWAVELLERQPLIAMAGFFHYQAAPCVSREMLIAQNDNWQAHRDFVSSAFILNSWVWADERFEWETHSAAFAEDVGYKEQLRAAGFILALPNYDLATNRGFGLGPSTVAVMRDGELTSQLIHHEPLIFARSPSPVDPPQAPHPPQDEMDFPVGVVIPTCRGREENLKLVLSSLDAQTRLPLQVVIVYDGCDPFDVGPHPYPIRHVMIEKHSPGHEQPRNVGVRHLQVSCPEAAYAWFLDGDIMVGPECLEEYYRAHVVCGGEPHIILGPYFFLPAGQQGIRPEVPLDTYRNISFQQYGVEHILRSELGSGLACFGGNMVWPIERFMEVGGFHPDLHHGRCEDGELGLRAASLGIGISFAAKARGYHQYHDVDYISARRKNERDVPLLNSIHPWVEGKGLIVTAEDGARFDFKCPTCDVQVNSLLYWEHASTHDGSVRPV